jgi:hypothetical protein
MASISERESREIEAANASGTTPVVFIHGLWFLPSSWANLVDFFKQGVPHRRKTRQAPREDKRRTAAATAPATTLAATTTPQPTRGPKSLTRRYYHTSPAAPMPCAHARQRLFQYRTIAQWSEDA